MKGTVALIPSGWAIEDQLEPLGLTLEDFAGRLTGGWLFGYVAALRSVGWEPAVVCTSSAVREPTRLVHAETGVQIHVVPVRRGRRLRGIESTLRGWLATPWNGLARALRAAGATAMLVQEYDEARFDGMVVLGRLMKLPVYGVFQGADAGASPLETAVRNLTLRAARGLIVPSARERERLRNYYALSPRRIADVPNPVDLDEWRAGDRHAARCELGLRSDAFLVVTHGRIDVWRKGLDQLVEAWLLFRSHRPLARLALIGSGPDEAQFRELLRCVAPSGVTWVDGHVTDRALLRRWLTAADAYVMTSRVEGTPVAPLEAMAMGLPVVATDAPGLAELFERGRDSGAVLVPREDPHALGAALSELAEDADLRRRLGGLARRTAEARFGAAAVGGALERVLRPRVRDRDDRAPEAPLVSAGGS
jgi:starch synthase